MRFQRDKDPKRALEIGLLQACMDLVKDTDINILDEAETRDMIIFESGSIWKYYPVPNTAADFMSTAAVTKSSGCHICIGTMNKRYHVIKNTGHLKPKGLHKLSGKLETGSSGTIEELYNILTKFLT